MINKISEYYRVSSDKDYCFAGHIHGGYEINIVIRGELEVTCGSNAFRLKAGDMVLFDAETFHRNNADKTCVFLSLGFVTNQEVFVKGFLQFYRLSPDNIAIVNVLDNELRFGIGRKSEAAKSLLWALILRAENDIHNKTAISDSAAVVYHNAVDIMNDKPYENYSVSEIAQQCGVSETTLKNAFAKYAGKGVAEYYFDLKMENAREMLMNGMPAKEITITLGFSSLSYFSQCFKRKNGCSIREYIKSKGKNING